MSVKKWLFDIACVVDPTYCNQFEYIAIKERMYPLRHWLISSSHETIGSFIKVYGSAPGKITAIVSLSEEAECYEDVSPEILEKAKRIPLRLSN